jgi:hypothetical protein
MKLTQNAVGNLPIGVALIASPTEREQKEDIR